MNLWICTMKFSKEERPWRRINSPEELADKLDYNPETGVFTYKSSGRVAGYDKDGYRRLGLLKIYAHRMAFYKMTGEWPNEIDHINRIKSDNRWENLRDVTHTENVRNIVVQKDNKSGILHVGTRKQGGFDVRIGRKFRSYVKTLEEAKELAETKRKEIYGEFYGT